MGPGSLATTVKLGVGRAGALHDVECRDRTAKTPQLQVSKILEPRDRFDRFSDAAADQNLPVLGLSTKDLMRNNRIKVVLVASERWCSSSRLGRYGAEC